VDDDAWNLGMFQQNMRHFLYVKQRIMQFLVNPELNSEFARTRRSRQRQRPICTDGVASTATHTAYATKMSGSCLVKFTPNSDSKKNGTVFLNIRRAVKNAFLQKLVFVHRMSRSRRDSLRRIGMYLDLQSKRIDC
jgi:hypothetical protein